ncbi:HepT-like ribonuclease domain-containing protein [Propionibacteriaceae bacterium Y2011]
MIISDQDRQTLTEILGFGREAADLVSRGKSTYDTDVLLQRAAQMICLNLGAVAKRLSAAVVEGHPDIRFTMMVALREKVAHGYRILDTQVIWDTVATAIPEDIAGVAALLDRAGTHRSSRRTHRAP